jgi:uncharacterized protein (DUF305 family)
MGAETPCVNMRINYMNKIILIVAVTSLLGVAIIASFIKSDNYSESQHDHVSHEESFSDSMDEHSGHMMPMAVSSEREFIEMMIPHHEEAVVTAKEVLARGATTQEMKELATGIITAQEKEISDMKNWYEAWYGVAYSNNGSYEPMMRELANLSGVELDKAFLEDMIMHHMGAIMMAKSVEAYITHDELRMLTVSIIKTQTEEIGHMKHELSHF